jgi:hypothetical protein
MHSKQYLLDCGGSVLSPILGIIASQNYPRVTNSYESIATVNVGGGGSATISFTSIPSTFKHLQVRGFSTFASNENVYFKPNGIDGTKGHQLQGDGATATADFFNAIPLYSSRTTTGKYVFIADILDYASTTKNKTVRSLAGGDDNGAGRVSLNSGFYDSTTAISSFTIVLSSGGSFTQYSQFALYGIRG